MDSENDPRPSSYRNRPLITLGAIIVALIIVAMCAFAVILLRRQLAPRPTPTLEILMTSIPAVVPADNFTVGLPAVLSGFVPFPENAPIPVAAAITEPVWVVTRINRLAYAMDGRNYDLATFRRIDGEETVRAYCINRGWERPEIGTEYLLSSDGVFIPLDDSDVDPIQRFQLIQ